MILDTILLVAGIACMIVALILVLFPRFVAAVPAYAGLVMLHYSHTIMVRPQYLIFWGVATLLVWGTAIISPSGEPDRRNTSNLYLGLATVAGALVGIAVGARVMVLGTVIGAIMGLVMYSRTPHGQWLKASGKTIWLYFAAKCLPAIVAVAIMGIALEGYIVDKFTTVL